MESIKIKYWMPFILLAIVVLAGCTGPIFQELPVTHSPSCNSLLVAPFRDRIGQTLELEETLNIIEAHFDTPLEKITVTQYADMNEWDMAIEWSGNGVNTTLLRSRNGFLAKIIVHPHRTHIATGRIIACVGSQPELYRAIYGPRMERKGFDYDFEVWFPAEGIVIQSRGSTKSEKGLPILSPNIAFTTLFIVAPGSQEDVYSQAAPGLMSLSGTQNEQSYLAGDLQPKPWPGGWEELYFIKGW